MPVDLEVGPADRGRGARVVEWMWVEEAVGPLAAEGLQQRRVLARLRAQVDQHAVDLETR